MLLIQVEVKFDMIHVDSEDVDISRFAIEAALYDNAELPGYSKNEGVADSSSYSPVLLKPKSLWSGFGFPGYHLFGKLEMPKLWSCENVRNYIMKIIICKQFEYLPVCLLGLHMIPPIFNSVTQLLQEYFPSRDFGKL